MFKALLKKIANEYQADQTYFGGDIEEDIHRYYGDGDSVLRWGMDRVLYDLSIIEALPAPAEGKVRVHADRAQAILDIAWIWEKKPTSEPESALVEKPTVTYSVQHRYDRNDGSWCDDLMRRPTLVSAIEEAQALLTRTGIAEVRIVAHDSQAANTIRIIHKNPTTEPAPDPAVVRDALLLVGVDVPSDEIEMRTDLACAEALEWARKAHLNASNCTVEVPTCPEWVAHWRTP